LHYQTKQQVNVVGDLALIGTRIQEKVIAKPGHFVNTQFAKKNG
jgi:UDP-3-O-acyl-N-acetylglucosamine deacetylase